MEIKERSKPAIPKNDNLSKAEKQLKNVSELYEKQFLREMVKQMRSTVSESSLLPSSFAEKYYREQLDEQYVESWGDQGGIGLGNLIYDQLLFRYGELMGLKIPNEKNSGPIPLGQKDNWGTRFDSQNKAIVFDKSQASNSNQTALNVESPWAGQWLGSFELENGLKVAKIQHDGFQSLLIGNLQINKIKFGETLKEGQRIGVLGPKESQLQWKLLKTENIQQQDNSDRIKESD